MTASARRRAGTWQAILDALQARARQLGQIDFDSGALDGSSIRAQKAAAGAKKKDEAGQRLSPEQSRARQALGQSRGGLTTKIHVLSEGVGKPIVITLTPGPSHESTQALALVDRVLIKGRPRRRFATLAGDKGDDSAVIRSPLRQRGTRPLIAHLKQRDGSYPPAAAGFDKEQYKRRNVIERLIERLKQNRRIASRYEKLAESYVAKILLAFIRIWVRDLLPYTPWFNIPNDQVYQRSLTGIKHASHLRSLLFIRVSVKISSLAQVFSDQVELLQVGLQVLDDLGGDDPRIRQVGVVFERIVLEPEDVQVHLVAFGQIFVGEALEPFTLIAYMAIHGIVAGDEIVQVRTFEGASLKCEMNVGVQVVDPEPLGSRLFAGRLTVEKQDIGFYPLCDL